MIQAHNPRIRLHLPPNSLGHGFHGSKPNSPDQTHYQDQMEACWCFNFLPQDSEVGEEIKDMLLESLFGD